MDKNAVLSEKFEELDEAVAELEQRAAEEPLAQVLAGGAGLVKQLLTAYALHAGKPMPETDDLLELLKAFVKGDPSLTAVRDNVRELVYYQNCLAMAREDALPKQAEKMVVHTVRHLLFYLKSRAEQEGRLS